MPTLHLLPDGTLEFLYGDDLSPLMSLGNTTIQRASTVDPRQENGQVNWYADLALSGGPELGPFPTREEAIVAETTWLNQNFLGRNRNPSTNRASVSAEHRHRNLIKLLRQPKPILSDQDADAQHHERALDELIIDILFLAESQLSKDSICDLFNSRFNSLELWLNRILQACGWE